MEQSSGLLGRVQGTPMLIKLFLSWYFWDRPRTIVQAYAAYAQAFSDAFSIVFLLRTLLQPWKNIVDDYPKRGFNPGLLLQIFTFNIITRMIGAVVRLGAVVFALFVQAAVLTLFIAYFAAWTAFPVIVILSISFLSGLI